MCVCVCVCVEVWGGAAGATNCVFERSGRDCMVCGSPCCQQDITARKRPTSYGNSNSVQVFSAYTFAAKRAPDWPGGQAGPQEGRFEPGDVAESGKKKKKKKALGQALFYSIRSCTRLAHVSPSLCLPLSLSLSVSDASAVRFDPVKKKKKKKKIPSKATRV